MGYGYWSNNLLKHQEVFVLNLSHLILFPENSSKPMLEATMITTRVCISGASD